MGLGRALIITFAFTLLEHWVEEGPLGRKLQSAVYELLHSRMPVEREAALPIVLVDISDLPAVGAAGTALRFTPRPELQAMIERLASARKIKTNSPVAIGVDIDLSPETNGFIAPGSIQLFNLCLGLSSNSPPLPVVLGVHRMASYGPRAWLARESYGKLAAAISREGGPVAERMPVEFQFGQKEKLPGFAWSLAEAYKGAGHQTPSRLWWRWLTDQSEKRQPIEELSEIQADEFHVNYSRHQEIATNIISYTNLLSPAADLGALAERLQDKIVIIGDASVSTFNDTGFLPGHGKNVPGVFIHASAIETLLHSPLRLPKFGVGLAFNLVLTTFTFCLITWASLRRSKRGPVSTLPLSSTMAILSALLYALLALLLARYGLLMLNVLAVCAAIPIHFLIDVFVEANRWKAMTRVAKPGELLEVMTTPETEDNE
jgi:CHASE2 domain-containing sensor protein